MRNTPHTSFLPSGMRVAWQPHHLTWLGPAQFIRSLSTCKSWAQMGDDDKLWARWLARGLLFDQRVASRLNYVAYLRLVERTRRALLEDAKVRSQLITPPDMIFNSLTPTIFLTPFWASDSDYAAQLYRALHSACRANGLFPVAVEFPLDLVAALEAGGSRIRLGDLDVGWMNALMSDPGNVNVAKKLWFRAGIAKTEEDSQAPSVFEFQRKKNRVRKRIQDEHWYGRAEPKEQKLVELERELAALEAEAATAPAEESDAALGLLLGSVGYDDNCEWAVLRWASRGAKSRYVMAGVWDNDSMDDLMDGDVSGFTSHAGAGIYESYDDFCSLLNAATAEMSVHRAQHLLGETPASVRPRGRKPLQFTPLAGYGDWSDWKTENCSIGDADPDGWSAAHTHTCA